jgi:hypothetical protein
MTKKIKNQSESAASAKLPIAGHNVAGFIDLTNKTGDVVKAHPSYSTLPKMQTAVTGWLGLAQTLDHQEQDIKTRHASLIALGAAREVAVETWKRATKKVLAVVDETASGSASAVKEWGFDISARTVRPVPSDAPTGLRSTISKKLVLTIEWHGVRNHKGYFVQIGDGTPNGWGPAIPVPEARYIPAGLSLGQHVSVRVAVQRANGMSAWTDALAIVMR